MPRLQYLARAFVPLVAAGAIDVATGAQGGAPPASLRTLQYQAITGPVLVPADAEVLTLDKWVSQPPNRPRLEWRPSGGIVAPVYVPVTVVAPERAWAPTYPDRAPGRPRPVDFPQTVAPLYVADVTVAVPPLSWAEALPDVVRRPRVVTGGSVAPVAVDAPAEVLTLDKWHSAPALRFAVQTRPEGGTVAPVETPAPAAPAPELSWAPSLADVVRLPRVVVGGTVAPVEPVADVAPPTVQAAAVQGGDAPLRLSTIQYQALTGPVLVPVEAPPPVPDFWLPTLPTLPVQRDGPAIQYAPLTGPVESVIETGWLRQSPDLVRARRVVTGGMVAPVEPVAAAPAVVLDWLGPIAHAPVISRRPLGGTVAPLYVADVTVVAPLRSWAPTLADVVRVKRARVGGVVAPVDSPASAASVPALSWAPVWPQPTRRIVRPSGGTVVPLAAPTGNRRRRVLLSEAPMIIARQSTARIVTVGPVLDASGVAVTDGVVADFKISKNGGVPAALNGSATLTHRHTGHYSLSLTATDLDTVGSAEIVIDDTVNVAPPKVLTVVEEATYDITFAAASTGAVPSVTGAVGSVTAGVTVTTNNDKTGYALGAGGIAAAAFAAGAIDAAAVATDAIDAASLAADAVTEIAEGVLTAAAANPIDANVQEVNDVTLQGVGTIGNEWRPV